MKEIGACSFEFCSTLTSIKIPDSVESIGDCAFSYCNSLTSIDIPYSITSIGYEAFYGCSSLQYNEYNNELYLGNSENPYLWLIETKDTSITSCKINDSCKFIQGKAFSGCGSLASVTIGNSVTSIGDNAFSGCGSLTSITVGNSVTSIGDCTFISCSLLSKVYYKGTASDWNNITIGSENECLKNATRYYYSESEPTESGNYWHYDTDGTTILEW